jgi:hypothetical protein
MYLTTLSQSEWFTTYLEYDSLKEMLGVIIHTSQSFMAILPQLHSITYHEREILFIHTGLVGGIVIHYYVLNEKPSKKFVELNKMLTDFKFVDAVGANPQCIYIPIVRLKRCTLRFPIDTSDTI